MESIDRATEIKRVKLVLFINLPLCVWALTAFIKSFDQGVTWKIVCAGVAFSLFLVVNVLLFLRLRKLSP